MSRTDPQINFRAPAEALADYREAAAECGLTVGEWARLILDHASGRVALSEQMERGRRAGSAVVLAAIGELDDGQVKRAAKRAGKGQR